MFTPPQCASLALMSHLHQFSIILGTLCAFLLQYLCISIYLHPFSLVDSISHYFSLFVASILPEMKAEEVCEIP